MPSKEPQSEQSNQLENMPPELRNMVYEFYLEDYKPTRVSLVDGKPVPPPLTRVCRQLRAEFLPMWQAPDAKQDFTSTRILKVQIINMDFEPLMQFIRDHELNRTLTMIDVTLTFTMPSKLSGATGRLRKWCDYVYRKCSFPTRKGSGGCARHFATKYVADYNWKRFHEKNAHLKLGYHQIVFERDLVYDAMVKAQNERKAFLKAQEVKWEEWKRNRDAKAKLALLEDQK